jgi:hypothetical protein
MHALDLRDGVIWATRLFLDREPTESDIASLVAGCSIDTMRRVFVDSVEYTSWLAAERANRIPPAADIDRCEGLKWAFRLLLGRELDDTTADQMKDCVKTVSDIRDTVIFSNEFRLRAEPGFVDLISYAAIGRFAPFATEPAAPGSFRDFIGTTTRCSFLPPQYLTLSGTVQHPPMAPYSPVLHGAPEWVATLRFGNRSHRSPCCPRIGSRMGALACRGRQGRAKAGYSEFRIGRSRRFSRSRRLHDAAFSRQRPESRCSSFDPRRCWRRRRHRPIPKAGGPTN